MGSVTHDVCRHPVCRHPVPDDQIVRLSRRPVSVRQHVPGVWFHRLMELACGTRPLGGKPLRSVDLPATGIGGLSSGLRASAA